MKSIGVIGAGAWGTALATVGVKAGSSVFLWAREEEVVASINNDHQNRLFLPDVNLDPRIIATSDLAALDQCDVLFLVTPCQFARATLGQLKTLGMSAPLVICSKGIEQDTGLLMTDVVAEILPNVVQAVLSGPTFAREVANGLPTAVTLACKDEKTGKAILKVIGSPTFRPYLGDDLIGAEIGGAVKNVIAIAAGIVEGRGLGDNARAALITRGMAEITRLGEAMGARPETLMGLAGFGDLMLTCSALQSRNMSLGHALGKGEKLEDILSARNAVTEGVYTAEAVTALARKLNISMPISEAVNDILHNGVRIDKAIHGLLTRPFTTEQ